jgi:hypothetical protein
MTATPTNTPAPTPCVGDCDGKGQVTVDEILTMVNIALGNTPISACEAGDANHDGQITVDEILTAVNNALDGCPSTRTYSVSGTISYYTGGLPVPGAAVELQGTTTLVTQTDANGQFVFETVPPGVWRIQPSKMGDSRGSIDVRDGGDMLRAADGVLTLTPEQRLACDVTGDGVVDQADVSSLLDYTVGNLTRFPAADRCASDWIFVPAPDAAPHQSVTPPLVTAEGCQPGSIEFAPLSAGATGQDFQAVLIGDCNLSWPN